MTLIMICYEYGTIVAMAVVVNGGCRLCRYFALFVLRCLFFVDEERSMPQIQIMRHC
jgi:hypothetical protein